ncbi:MAG: OadG family protein, partial [Clostridia bacterium]|nr:OadG family protein [Clostridia bacterium]
MKRIIGLSLAALMLVMLLLTATSCELSMESMTGYTRLRDHVTEKADQNGEVALDGSAEGFTAVKLTAPIKKGEDKPEAVCVIAEGGSSTTLVQMTVTLTGSTEKAEVVYRIVNRANTDEYTQATATIILTAYTGSELIALNSIDGFHFLEEMDYRSAITGMLNCTLKVLDEYLVAELDMRVSELGFIALSDKYMANVDAAEVEEDLGGAFSSQRLTMAGLMIIQGMGMVFLVLAVLWLVLLVFKKVFYKDPAKASKAPKAVEPAPAPAPVAPATSDDALVAAITAAVAAYIESD